AALKVLPRGAAVEARDGWPIPPQPPAAERCPSGDVALGHGARVGARPFDDVGEADPEVEQPMIELEAERRDAERASGRRGQPRRRERRPEAIVRAREIVTAQDRARAGIDPDEHQAQAGRQVIGKRPEWVPYRPLSALRWSSC